MSAKKGKNEGANMMGLTSVDSIGFDALDNKDNNRDCKESSNHNRRKENLVAAPVEPALQKRHSLLDSAKSSMRSSSICGFLE